MAKKHYHVKGYYTDRAVRIGLKAYPCVMVCPTRNTLAEARKDAKAYNEHWPDKEWVIQRCGHVECLGRVV